MKCDFLREICTPTLPRGIQLLASYVHINGDISINHPLAGAMQLLNLPNSMHDGYMTIKSCIIIRKFYNLRVYSNATKRFISHWQQVNARDDN